MYEKDFNEDFKCLFDVTFFGFLLVSLVQIVAIVFSVQWSITSIVYSEVVLQVLYTVT